MEMWERFDTFGHQNICFTMKMKDFTLKESPPAMFKMLDVTGPGVGRTWNIFPFTDGGSPLSQPVLLRKSKQETMVFTIKLVGEKPEAKPGWMIFPFIHFD